VISLAPLLIAGCHGSGSAVVSSSGTAPSAPSSPSPVNSSPTVPTGSASSLASPASAEQAFATSFAKLQGNPPTYHGVPVSHADDPANDFGLEVWMEPPAFRVEISIGGDPRRFIVVTQDGKRFGGWDPVTHEFGMMDGLTEQARSPRVASLRLPAIQPVRVQPGSRGGPRDHLEQTLRPHPMLG